MKPWLIATGFPAPTKRNSPRYTPGLAAESREPCRWVGAIRYDRPRIIAAREMGYEDLRYAAASRAAARSRRHRPGEESGAGGDGRIAIGRVPSGRSQAVGRGGPRLRRPSRRGGTPGPHGDEGNGFGAGGPGGEGERTCRQIARARTP